MNKAVKKIVTVLCYLGAVLVMVAMMTAACAGGAESMEDIKTVLGWAAIIGGCSLPFFAVAGTVAIIAGHFDY